MEDAQVLEQLIRVANKTFHENFDDATMATGLPGIWAPDQSNNPDFLDMLSFFYAVEAAFGLNEFTNIEMATCDTFGYLVRLLQEKLATSAS